MDNFKKHADLSGSEIIQDTVTNINKNQEGFLITTSQKKEYKTKKIILTT
jgi:thioredoxin reductase